MVEEERLSKTIQDHEDEENIIKALMGVIIVVPYIPGPKCKINLSGEKF